MSILSRKTISMVNKRFTSYAIFVLLVNIIVILWGAYVRATGSGAGCGSHWPLCNGEVVPMSRQLETMIEFIHRLSSGLAFLLVVGLLFWALKGFPRRHPVRLGAALTMFFIITEALVGAGLVLFEWVADDTSTARVISMAVHLINTFLLLASISLTIWWSIIPVPLEINLLSFEFWMIIIVCLGVIFLGVSGAVTALGDTLFPTVDLGTGLRDDFNPESHFLVRMRVIHPVIAILVGALILYTGIFSATTTIKKSEKMIALILVGLYLVQLVAGLVNLLLLAPIWMQIVHLLIADAVWISLIILTSAKLTPEESLRQFQSMQTSLAYES